jgi:histidine phosphotransferase ChpT
VIGSDLSALVSARLCHDLISPIGAIGNGLELLQMTMTEGSPELDLITGSLGSALAKLRFYRLAFGPADAQARQSFEEAAEVTGAMFQGRFTVAWDCAGRDMSRTTARLVYLAILCLERSLPMGGGALVTIVGETIDLAVEGRRTAPPRDLWALVTDGAPPEEMRPDAVQFAVLRKVLGEDGHRVEVDFTDTGVRLGIRLVETIAA